MRVSCFLSQCCQGLMTAGHCPAVPGVQQLPKAASQRPHPIPTSLTSIPFSDTLSSVYGSNSYRTPVSSSPRRRASCYLRRSHRPKAKPWQLPQHILPLQLNPRRRTACTFQFCWVVRFASHGISVFLFRSPRRPVPHPGAETTPAERRPLAFLSIIRLPLFNPPAIFPEPCMDHTHRCQLFFFPSFLCFFYGNINTPFYTEDSKGGFSMSNSHS